MTFNSQNKILLESMDEFVEGHSRAKKALITMLQRSRLRYYQKYIRDMYEDCLVEPMKILLIGQSGTGKTHLVSTLEKLTYFPLVKVDATQFNVTGGSGGLKVGHLQKQIRDTAEIVFNAFPEQYLCLEGAIDRTVVFIDEIDKLGGIGNVGEWNRGVQSDFLTLFDNKDEFSGVSFIFAGAFSELTKYRAHKQARSLGFTSKEVDATSELQDIDDKICQTGILPELLGRMNTIVELDVFNEADLYNILKTRIIPNKMRDLAAYNIFDIEVPDDKLLEMASRAFKSSQGIRYLKRAVDAEFLELEFEADTRNFSYNYLE